MANEMCDCFTGFQKDFSAEAKAFLKTVAESDQPRKTMQEGLVKLDPKDAQQVIEQFKQVSERTSSVNKCMTAFDTKHAKETTKDRNGLLKKLREEMKKNGSCEAGAAIINLGLSEQGVK